MQRPLTLALVLAGVFFLGMIVGYTHVQPEQEFARKLGGSIVMGR